MPYGWRRMTDHGHGTPILVERAEPGPNCRDQAPSCTSNVQILAINVHRLLYIWFMPEDLSALVARLRTAGGDSTNVEIKSASGGLPDSLASTLSALANLPGGGMIILGLDESLGFRPVPLADRTSSSRG